MPTYLRPHDGVKCPLLTPEELKRGYLIPTAICDKCPHVEEVRRPWFSYAVRCSLEGESDDRTVEYG